MGHTRHGRLLGIGVVAGIVGLAAPVEAQRVARPARTARTDHAGPRNCVQFVQETTPDGRAVTFTLTNRCTIPVVGNVSWQVACGRTDTGTPEDHREDLAPHEHRVLTASTAACGSEGWSLQGVRWTWRVADAPDAARGGGPVPSGD